jgi:hypothetical protein
MEAGVFAEAICVLRALTTRIFSRRDMTARNRLRSQCNQRYHRLAAEAPRRRLLQSVPTDKIRPFRAFSLAPGSSRLSHGFGDSQFLAAWGFQVWAGARLPDAETRALPTIADHVQLFQTINRQIDRYARRK